MQVARWGIAFPPSQLYPRPRSDSYQESTKNGALQVARWFAERAKQVDLVTGSFTAALEVVDAGVALVGEPHSDSLAALGSRIRELQTAASIGTSRPRS